MHSAKDHLFRIRLGARESAEQTGISQVAHGSPDEKLRNHWGRGPEEKDTLEFGTFSDHRDCMYGRHSRRGTY